MHYVET